MAVVKAFKWMRFLSDADEIRKKKEKTKNANAVEMQAYNDAVKLRNLAFIELLKAGIPFIHIEDDDLVRISLDEMNYDIDCPTLRLMLGDEDYKKIIENPNFTSDFNSNKEIAVDEQKNDEYETLRKKILSYGLNMDDPATDEPEKPNKRTGKREFGHESDIEDESAGSKTILDYRVDSDGVARVISTTEFAFIGIEHGAGTTHAAMTAAQTLASENQKKVALVELNNSNNMRDLGEWLIGKEIETNNYPLGNVDVYFDVDYLAFSTMYKDNYDYVIIDFGCYNERREVMKEFIRIQNKFILASGIDWNLAVLNDFYEDFIVDKFHTAIYLTPYLSGELLDPVKKIVSPNKVYTLPFSINPFQPDEKTKNVFKKILGEKESEVQSSENKEDTPKSGIFANLFRKK